MVDIVGRTRMIGLTDKYNSRTDKENLNFLRNVLEIACKMNRALENRIEHLFQCNIEEVTVLFPIDF